MFYSATLTITRPPLSADRTGFARWRKSLADSWNPCAVVVLMAGSAERFTVVHNETECGRVSPLLNVVSLNTVLAISAASALVAIAFINTIAPLLIAPTAPLILISVGLSCCFVAAIIPAVFCSVSKPLLKGSPTAFAFKHRGSVGRCIAWRAIVLGAVASFHSSAANDTRNDAAVITPSAKRLSGHECNPAQHAREFISSATRRILALFTSTLTRSARSAADLADCQTLLTSTPQTTSIKRRGTDCAFSNHFPSLYQLVAGSERMTKAFPNLKIERVDQARAA